MTSCLFHDFHDAVGARIDEHRAIVDDGISISAAAVFRWNVIIGYAGLRQHCADPDVLAISIGRIMTFCHVAAEARALVNSQDTVDATDDAPDDAATDG